MDTATATDRVEVALAPYIANKVMAMTEFGRADADTNPETVRNLRFSAMVDLLMDMMAYAETDEGLRWRSESERRLLAVPELSCSFPGALHMATVFHNDRKQRGTP